MNSLIHNVNQNTIRARINQLYETCGNISPIVYFINALTKEFNSLLENDSKAFEIKLSDAEKNIELFYNREGVSKSIAESDALNHLMVYSVCNIKESEARYFYHLELANIFIRDRLKSTKDVRFNLCKVFNGYSVVVTSPLFFN